MTVKLTVWLIIQRRSGVLTSITLFFCCCKEPFLTLTYLFDHIVRLHHTGKSSNNNFNWDYVMNFDKITTLSLSGKYNQEYSHCHSVIFSMCVSSRPDIAAALPSALPDECSEIHWRNTVSTVNFFFFGFFLEWRNHCILQLLLERCKWFKHDKELSSSHLRCYADFHSFFFTFQVFDSNVFTLCLRKICEKGFSCTV